MNEGTVVTFYSYKGGVGRSFALANVGTALASWGYRVLCIDWDLDAPGLTHYFEVADPAPGLIELVSAAGNEKSPDWHSYLCPVKLPLGDVKLDFITAGCQD